ncbi:MAG: hypothetical protein F7C34_02400 [Desulfurococcales archaeon]|nr:hypothetical protein [Desulfurococcales archaeon]
MATLVFTIVLIGAGLFFLYNSLTLFTVEPPHVAAGMLAAIIGLSLVSAAVTLLRTWLIASEAGRAGEE